MKLMRRVISDNDGCDIWLARSLSRDDFLACRFAALADAGITTVFYTGFSQFGVVAYDSALREATWQGALVDLPVAPTIQYGIDFCHAHGMEYFLLSRMNDTHDGSLDDGESRKWFLANRFKAAHPDCLLGDCESPPRFGRYSSVNYALAPVRDAFMAIFEEQLDRFDVDGMTLDFFRHAVFFPSTAAGRPATADELACMTELVRRAASALRRASQRRGRKLSLAVRVPDDLECAIYLGLDLEAWLSEGLIDMLCVSSYLQLNYWDYSVALGHRYNVPVYPSLDEPRMPIVPGVENEPRLRRRSFEATRGRVLNVLNSGADGYLLYNYRYLEAHARVFRAVTDPARLYGGSKRYFSSLRGFVPGPGCADPTALRRFMRIPTLSPLHPEPVGSALEGEIYVGRAPESSEEALLLLWFSDGVAKPPELTIWINSAIATPGAVSVFFNNLELTDFYLGELLPDSLPRVPLKAFIPRGLVRAGANRFRVERTVDAPLILTDAAVYVVPSMD